MSRPGGAMRHRPRATWPPPSDICSRRRRSLLAIGGLPGTGKSTLARALAPELGGAPGALVLRSDEIRKRQHGVAPEQRLPQSAYSDAASEAVFADLADMVRSHRSRRPRGDRRRDVHRSAPSRDGRSAAQPPACASSAYGSRRRCRSWRRGSPAAQDDASDATVAVLRAAGRKRPAGRATGSPSMPATAGTALAAGPCGAAPLLVIRNWLVSC